MSRSNPTVHNPHPAEKWFEWDGESGAIRWYDKKEKKNVAVKDGFSFLLLDELAAVTGWSESNEGGITSNEVRDTTKEVLVVKVFKGPKIAQGFYQDIRDRIIAAGGYYTSVLYIAFKEEGRLKLGGLKLKGAGLNAWVEFKKKNREALYKAAVQFKGSTQHKKGKIQWHVPTLFLRDVADETNEEAKKLDELLQVYLKGYFERTTVADQVGANEGRQADARDDVQYHPDEHPAAGRRAHASEPLEGEPAAPPVEEDEVPF